LAERFAERLAALLGALLAAATLSAQHREFVLAGRVLDGDGKPAEADLELRWRTHPELPDLAGLSLGERGLESLRARSDPRGEFRLALPGRGPFLLCARRGELASEPAFPVLAGDFRELRLQPVPVAAGVARDPHGAPLAGVHVVLTPDPSTWTRLAMYRLPEQRAECTTDRDGRFSLPLEGDYLHRREWSAFLVPWVQAEAWAMPRQPCLLRPTRACAELQVELHERHTDTYTANVDDGVRIGALQFVHDGGFLPPRAPAEGGRLALPADDLGRWLLRADGCEPLVAEPGKRALLGVDKELRVRAGARVHVVLRRGGQPLRSARVLWSIADASLRPVEWSAMTADDGSVGFDAAPAANPALLLQGFVEIDGVFAPFCAQGAGAAAELGAREVALRALAGRVFGPTGEPCPYARVALEANGNGVRPSFRVTYADHGGRFEFAGVPAEPLLLLADADAGLGAADVRADATGVDVRVGAGDSIEGTVRDAEGNPVAGAWITAAGARAPGDRTAPGPSPGAIGPVTFTDANGAFAFRGLPPGGSYSLLANYLRDGGHCGGGNSARSGQRDVVVQTRPVKD
jgi:hypothetical protein